MGPRTTWEEPMRSSLKLTVFATMTAFTIACSGNPSAPGVPGSPSTPSDNNPPIDGNTDPTNNPAAPTASYSGVYDVVTPLDFTQGGVLPGIAGPALGALSELHDHPGDALYTFLAGTNIPYLSDILNKVPDFLRDALTGALDGLITKNVYASYPIVDEITSVVEGIAEISKKADLHDQITIHTPAADGTAQIEHQLNAADFTLLGSKTSVHFSTGAKAKALQKVTGIITPHRIAPVADADITMQGGTFSLPMGELILGAAGPLLFSEFGGASDLSGALINLVPCDAFGQDISDAVDNVIPKSDVVTLCQGALTLVATEVETQVKQLNMDGVVLSSSSGKLYDASIKKPTPDYQSDRLAEGTGSWTFTVSGSSATVPTTLAGDRVADAK
jgi:hypothetical protein